YLFRHGHAIFRDRRRTKFLVEYYVAAFWAESYLHCFGELVHAIQNCVARFLTMNYHLCCHCSSSLLKSIYLRPPLRSGFCRYFPADFAFAVVLKTPRISSSRMMRYSSSSIFTSEPPYLPNSTR